MFLITIKYDMCCQIFETHRHASLHLLMAFLPANALFGEAVTSWLAHCLNCEYFYIILLFLKNTIAFLHILSYILLLGKILSAIKCIPI